MHNWAMHNYLPSATPCTPKKKKSRFSSFVINTKEMFINICCFLTIMCIFSSYSSARMCSPFPMLRNVSELLSSLRNMGKFVILKWEKLWGSILTYLADLCEFVLKPQVKNYLVAALPVADPHQCTHGQRSYMACLPPCSHN